MKPRKQHYGTKWYAPNTKGYADRWEQTFGRKVRRDEGEEIVYGSDTETGRRTYRVKPSGGDG